LFALQEEIVQTIVTTLAIKISAAERARVMRKDTDNLEAYDYVLRGWEYFKAGTRSANVKSKEMFKKAIELNPNDASSLHRFAMLTLYSGQTDEAIAAVKTALRFDPNIAPSAFYLLGIGNYLKGQYNYATKALKKGVVRRSDFVDLHVALAAAYAQGGRQEDAAGQAKTVLRLAPFFEVESYGEAFRNPADREKILAGLRKAGLE
jgi:tetratricopeptide (TPR) repeat protein